MLGSADIKVRPLKLALMVDPNSALQVREAIRLASTQWGGMFFPIIPVHKRMPASWREGPLKAPPAHDVVKGYLDGFDPDILVQFGRELPKYILDSKLKVLKPENFWSGGRDKDANEPAYGIGVLDVLQDIFQEHFKFKAKYPLKAIVPVIPKGLGLFWASVFGEYPVHIAEAIDKGFADALDISKPEVRADKFRELTDRDVLFPRRVTQWATRVQGGSGFRRNAAVFFMDASKIEDVIDFWNLRASGRQVLPLPKQFLEEESFRQVVVEFLGEHRRPWGSGGDGFDVASLIRSRHSTMDEMQAFAKSLARPSAEGKTGGATQQMSLQHWYPRLWDEWARGKDGGVADVYGEDEETIDIEGEEHLSMRLKSLIPSFGRENWYWSQGRCVNEFDLRLYGADEHLAEVYPKVEGDQLLHAITGNIGRYGEWRVGRHGLARLVSRVSGESRKAPESERIFFAWLKDRGWDAKLSSPGILAKQIYKRLGGVVSMLADKDVLALIEHMNGGMVSKGGAQKDDRIVAEREVSVAEVKRKLNAHRYGPFKPKDFQRMRYLAEMFPGAILVFSTLRESLTKEEIAALRRLAKFGRKYWKAERPVNPVLILTGAELLTWKRPPLCWNEELQKRFQNVYSLMEHCNASQQIYLGLPSWQEDWHATFERRRLARARRSQG